MTTEKRLAALQRRAEKAERELKLLRSREGELQYAIRNAQDFLVEIRDKHHGKRREDFGTVLGHGNDWIHELLELLEAAKSACGEGWVHPEVVQGARKAFEECFQQLQDQQEMTDEGSFSKYRDALFMLGSEPGSYR